jgi:RimJ/RimL family protein N-acetyltransferase
MVTGHAGGGRPRGTAHLGVVLSDLECLRIEIDTNWCRDQRGRLSHERVPEAVAPWAPHLLWAGARQGSLLDLGVAVPDRLAEALRRLHDDEPVTRDPTLPPVHAATYRDLVTEAVGPVRITRVVCFVFDGVPEHPLAPEWRGRAEVVTSEDPAAAALLGLLPAGHVDPGRGPWAAVTVGGRPVSACSTARSFEHGAEAGTWTDPAFRGVGFAATATTAWASLLLPGPRVLFYCTDEGNRSSQQVAARLGLRATGWLWRLDPASH